MAWERRKNSIYYYRSVRRGDKVCKEYLGSGANAAIVEQTIETLKQTRKALCAQQREIRDEAATSAARLNQLLQIPLPQLVGLFAQTHVDTPKLSPSRSKLVASKSAQELASWGRQALQAQIMWLSGGSPSIFTSLSREAKRNLLMPAERSVHIVEKLYYERYFLVSIQEAYFRFQVENPSAPKMTLWKRKAITAAQHQAAALEAWRRAQTYVGELFTPPESPVAPIITKEEWPTLGSIRVSSVSPTLWNDELRSFRSDGSSPFQDLGPRCGATPVSQLSAALSGNQTRTVDTEVSLEVDPFHEEASEVMGRVMA